MSDDDDERFDKVKKGIRSWRGGQLMVACITLVAFAVALAVIAGDGLPFLDGNADSYKMLFVAVLLGIGLAWIWFGAHGFGQGVTVADVFYAVALQTPGGLKLLCALKRGRVGDIYFFVPSSDREASPHVSYHKSGRRHLKSYDWKHFQTQLQKPNQAFAGSETLLAMAIPPGQATAYPQLEKPERYEAIFEIPLDTMSSVDHHTLAVDVVEPGKGALRGPWKEIVAQKTFDDAIPWLLITLWKGLD